MARSRAQLRAIFASLRRAGAVAGVGAGLYYGGKKLRQHIKDRRRNAFIEREQNIQRTILKKPIPREVAMMKQQFAAILDGLSAHSRREVLAAIKMSRQQDINLRKPKTLQSTIRNLKRTVKQDALFEAGIAQGRREATDIYEQKFKLLDAIDQALPSESGASHPLSFLLKALRATGPDVAPITEKNKAALSAGADIILGEDVGYQLQHGKYGRDWLDNQKQKVQLGLISNKQYFNDAMKFHRFKMHVKNKAAREAQYRELPSKKAFIEDRGSDATQLPSVRRKKRADRSRRRGLGGY